MNILKLNIILIGSLVPCALAFGPSDYCDSVLDEAKMQTNNCQLVQYTKQNLVQCLDLSAHNRRQGLTSIYFIGDSRMRQQFESFLHMIPTEHFRRKIVEVERTGLTPHEDFDYYSELYDVRIACLWRPVINQKLIDELNHWTLATENVPSFILLGIAAHHMYNRYVHDPKSFERNLTRLEAVLNKLNRMTKVLWWNQLSTVDSHRTLGFLNAELVKIYSEKMNLYNKMAKEILKRSKISIWTSGSSLAEEYIRSCDFNARVNRSRYYNCWDFIHTGLVAIHKTSQLLYNYLCNKLLLASGHFAINSNVCCS